MKNNLKLIALTAALVLSACGTTTITEQGNLKVLTYDYPKINYAPEVNLKWKAQELCPNGYEHVRNIRKPVDKQHAREIWHIKCL
jgi:hypothetical protein